MLVLPGLLLLRLCKGAGAAPPSRLLRLLSFTCAGLCKDAQGLTDYTGVWGCVTACVLVTDVLMQFTQLQLTQQV